MALVNSGGILLPAGYLRRGRDSGVGGQAGLKEVRFGLCGSDCSSTVSHKIAVATPSQGGVDDCQQLQPDPPQDALGKADIANCSPHMPALSRPTWSQAVSVAGGPGGGAKGRKKHKTKWRCSDFHSNYEARPRHPVAMRLRLARLRTATGRSRRIVRGRRNIKPGALPPALLGEVRQVRPAYARPARRGPRRRGRLGCKQFHHNQICHIDGLGTHSRPVI